jgi:hypothetical protein
LCRLTFPDKWEVHSSLKMIELKKSLSRSKRSNISEQKVGRTILSVAFNFYYCSRYGLTFRRLRNIFQIVGWGICSSRLARYVDFRRLLMNASRTLSTSSLDARGRPWPSALWTTHPVSANFSCHQRILSRVSGFLRNLMRNFRWTSIVKREISNQKQQAARSFPVHASRTATRLRSTTRTDGYFSYNSAI